MFKSNSAKLYNKLKECSKLAVDGCIGLSVGTLVYETNDDFVEIDYREMGFDLIGLIHTLEELSKQNLIEIIDTQNMNLFIYIK